MLLFFSLTSYPAEIAYFNSPNRELSKSVRVLALCISKIVNPSRSVCLKTVQRKSFERGNFLVLRPILVKFYIQTRLIESFPTIFQMWWFGEEKLHFTPVHILRQLKRDEALIPPLRRVVEF